MSRNSRREVSVRGAASDAARTARQLGGNLGKEFKGLVSDAEDLLHSTADTMGTQTAAARARLSSRLAEVKDLVGDGIENFKRHGSEMVGASDDYVHERPWQAMGFAALAGVAVGLALARR